MPEESPREFEISFAATDELEKQVARSGIGRHLLQKQAEVIAAIASIDEDDFLGVLERTHVVEAAETLSQMLAQAKQRRNDAPTTLPCF